MDHCAWKMTDERTEIPLEEIDKDVSKGKYLLIRTGGHHPFWKVPEAPERFKKNTWPYIKKIGGNLQHKNKYGTINGSVSIKKPYINYTVEKDVDNFGVDHGGRPHRKKSYFHIVIGKAWVENPRGLIHRSDGGRGNKVGLLDHINNMSSDYRVENLRWVTPSENSIGYPQHMRQTRQQIYLHQKKAGWID